MNGFSKLVLITFDFCAEALLTAKVCRTLLEHWPLVGCRIDVKRFPASDLLAVMMFAKNMLSMRGEILGSEALKIFAMMFVKEMKRKSIKRLKMMYMPSYRLSPMLAVSVYLMHVCNSTLKFCLYSQIELIICCPFEQLKSAHSSKD